MSLPAYAIESVDNALRVLLLFREHPNLRVTDVSENLGVARSTAHRLLSTLAHRGFVQQERVSKAYRLGPSLIDLGASIAGRAEIKTAAHSGLVRLAEQFDETLQLVVLVGDNMRFIDSVECGRAVRVAARTGEVLPGYATAGGKVLLAALSDGDLEGSIQSSLRRITDATITNRTSFREEIEDIRRLGYALNRGESLDGLRAVAVPIVDSAHRTVASFAISVPAERGSVERLVSFVPRMKAEAAAVGAAL